ncbi:MAG: hypothetical protein FWG67_06130 [Defluviitaleaceae bacterium]|nr:hypothetical protein [Defluviitaleaceae bacterium]
MKGREEKSSNDLFYVCSLIDYIARKTKNHRKDVVNALGKEKIQKLYDLADVYHSDSIDKVSDDFIKDVNLTNGNFDNVGACMYGIPTHWDIGKVYKRLILGIAREKNIDLIDALFLAYHSFVSEKIDDYNSSFYYEHSGNILISFLEGIMM